jgi:hypothetical protein
MTAAVSSRIWSLNGTEPQVVLMPATASRSFAPYGTPWSGPRRRPLAISASAAAADFSARSGVSVITACSFGSSVSIRSR